LAYRTLRDPEDRKEYDEYLAQLQAMSSFYGAKFEEVENPDVKANRERREKERGKKRFMDDFSYANDEFFAAWQNRTFNFSQPFGGGIDGENVDPTKELETLFDGRDLYSEVQVTFDEVMQPGGVTKEITVDREVICSSCDGSREEKGSQSSKCYSCGGTGMKEDALFHKQTKCNTC
jgi:DnaJ-class molecular chaperone